MTLGLMYGPSWYLDPLVFFVGSLPRLRLGFRVALGTVSIVGVVTLMFGRYMPCTEAARKLEHDRPCPIVFWSQESFQV